MQVFELHFNPKLKKDSVFDSFCYEPENVYEKRLGSLFMVGELKNALPQNARFLDNLARVIKGNFYAFPVKEVEKSLKESLKRANEFLEKEVKKNNTRWLGNLNFAVISLKKFNLNFTKVGDLKILLLRGGQAINIGKELEFQEIEPYPLKIFLHTVSGKLSTDDIIFASTEEVFSAFTKGDKSIPLPQKTKGNREIFPSDSLLGKIAKLISFEEKKLKKILREKDKILSEISGVCLLIVLKPKVLPKLALSFEKEVPLFPIKEIFKPLINKIKLWRSNLYRGLVMWRLVMWRSNLYRGLKILKKIIPKPKIQISLPSKKIFPSRKLVSFVEKIKNFPKVVRQRFSEKLAIFKKIIFSREFKKKLILISTLTFFLLVGFFIFKRGKEVPLREAPEILSKIEEKINMAENFLILKEEEKANSMFQEAWEEILPLTKTEHPYKMEALVLKESIERELYDLNKLEKIAKPELLFEFQESEFLPQKMVKLDKALYFLNPYSKGLYRFEKGEKIKIETDQKFAKAIPFDKSSILFFSKPNKLVFWQENRFGKTFSLKLPSPDFTFTDFSSFLKNIYLLDAKKGEIIKYSSPLVINKDFPQRWLAPETERVVNAKSMAIDGSVWILNKKNNIERYYLGKYQETFILDFFPTPEKIEKILVNKNLPYLFLLEPNQNRIIILDKTGKIVKQFQSEKFDNLKDFAISEDGIIYLLSGQKVYQIKFKK